MPFWRGADEPPPSENYFLIVGLGNPGSQYQNTRHNVGFMLVETLARRHGLQFKNSRQRAEIARGTVAGVPIILAEPVTFMNESGNAVVRLLAYYRVPIDRLIVVCDDLDLPFGTLRVRGAGSAGGQRGLQSIVQSTGTDGFARLRLGIGRPPGSAINYVLGRFPPDEERRLPALLEIGADAIEMAIQDGVDVAMNRFNRDWLPALSS